VRTAIYPGSFDPVTMGHWDVIQRADKLVDRLIVAVLHNPAKQAAFTVDERVAYLRELVSPLPHIEVTSFHGLLVDYAKQMDANFIVRSVRAFSDFEYEFQMALMNRKLRHTVETVFMMPHERYTYIASRLIKEVASLGAPVTGLVPPPVEERLAQKFSHPR
jgi:pantetheine-phosphate adenylyltransferase